MLQLGSTLFKYNFLGRRRLNGLLWYILKFFIKNIKTKHSCRSNSEALELIIREHEKNLNIPMENMIEILGDRVAEKIKASILVLKRVSNNSDRNIQVLLELMNGLFIAEDLPDIFPSKEKEHEAYITAKKEVDKRIESQRVKKLDKEY